MSGSRSFAAHRDAVAAGHFVRVVNYHNTLASDRDALRSDLARYARDYVPLLPDDLDAYLDDGRWPADRPGFIPVFYEGFRNGYDVAAPVCEELGIAAWFAIVTGFVDCPVPEQEVFARSHLLRLPPNAGDGAGAGDAAGDGRLAMTWDEVADLAQRHVVFAHTATHESIAETVTEQDIRREVVEPKARLDGVTGQDSPAFAWRGGSPFGSRAAQDDALIEAGYRFLVSNTMIQRIQRIQGIQRPADGR